MSIPKRGSSYYVETLLAREEARIRVSPSPGHGFELALSAMAYLKTQTKESANLLPDLSLVFQMREMFEERDGISGHQSYHKSVRAQRSAGAPVKKECGEAPRF